MAKILFGNGVAAIRGSQGGTVYSRNANGAYTRNRTKPVNANSMAQQAPRSTFANVSASWRGITSGQQLTWINGAVNYPYTDKLGQTAYYTGSQIYKKLNGALRQAGESAITDCPVPITLPEVLEGQLTFSAGDMSLTVLMTGGTTVIPADTSAIIFATNSISNGVTRPKKKLFKKILTVASGVDFAPLDTSTDYAAVFGAAALTGATVFYAVALISTTTGQTTATFRIKMSG